MKQTIASTFYKSTLLLFFSIVICCIIYPLALWTIGQVFFPFQANGSIIYDKAKKPIGSHLIAQAFTKDEYFHPRPSAASYDASASSSSALAASNYALRDRIARALGPIVKYRNGVNAGQLVASDIEKWFQQDTFQGKPNIVAQWATLHPSLAQAWIAIDPSHAAYVDHWIKSHPNLGNPKDADRAVVFFQSFSKENPGQFPAVTTNSTITNGMDIQSIFFDMWRQDHADVELEDVPADLVTTSASGLDPHISLINAQSQLDRVVTGWAAKIKRDPNEIKPEIEQILNKHIHAPWNGLIGESFINVLEVNLALNQHYGI